jgi:glycosyltransferase involved in cell wall biosynthesis
MMASADLLVAILEPDASKFSVPSKVLTYLCSSRAVLGVLPPDNSVAEILSTEEAGVVVDPSDRALVVKQAAALLDDPDRRHAMGRSGRAYAERTFSPETAADQFLGVFGDLVAAPSQDPAGTALPGATTR